MVLWWLPVGVLGALVLGVFIWTAVGAHPRARRPCPECGERALLVRGNIEMMTWTGWRETPAGQIPAGGRRTTRFLQCMACQARLADDDPGGLRAATTEEWSRAVEDAEGSGDGPGPEGNS